MKLCLLLILTLLLLSLPVFGESTNADLQILALFGFLGVVMFMIPFALQRRHQRAQDEKIEAQQQQIETLIAKTETLITEIETLKQQASSS